MMISRLMMMMMMMRLMTALAVAFVHLFPAQLMPQCLGCLGCLGFPGHAATCVAAADYVATFRGNNLLPNSNRNPIVMGSSKQQRATTANSNNNLKLQQLLLSLGWSPVCSQRLQRLRLRLSYVVISQRSLVACCPVAVAVAAAIAASDVVVTWFPLLLYSNAYLKRLTRSTNGNGLKLLKTT